MGVWGCVGLLVCWSVGVGVWGCGGVGVWGCGGVGRGVGDSVCRRVGRLCGIGFARARWKLQKMRVGLASLRLASLWKP